MPSASLHGLWVQTPAWCGQKGSQGTEGREQHVAGAEARGGVTRVGRWKEVGVRVRQGQVGKGLFYLCEAFDFSPVGVGVCWRMLSSRGGCER